MVPVPLLWVPTYVWWRLTWNRILGVPSRGAGGPPFRVAVRFLLLDVTNADDTTAAVNAEVICRCLCLGTFLCGCRTLCGVGKGCGFCMVALKNRLERRYGQHHLHFITCSCYRRRPLLGGAKSRDVFLKILDEVRERYQFSLVGYVVMAGGQLFGAAPESA
jgi:hypothetical protein